MAHFAELNDENVIRVVISNDQVEGDEETLGADCQELLERNNLKQTSYNRHS